MIQRMSMTANNPYAAPEATHARPELPSLYRDPSFWGATFTQFFGAFNDNLYKQLVLLWAVDPTKDWQSIAAVLFAMPFVLGSGYSGYLADRSSKRTIIVACKVAEIGIMFLAMLAFSINSLYAAFAVLFFMGMHSTVFGPPKYGILPELFRDEDLPSVNGVIQMTTFLAVILGMASAGFLAKQFGDRLWVASCVCMGIAVVGTMTSLLIRRTPIAHAKLPFRWSSLFISADTLKMMLADRPLIECLILTSVFWFVGAVVQMSVNSLGKVQLGVDPQATSLMAASIAIGIVIGCGLAGKLSGKRVNFRLASFGAWSMAIGLAVLSSLGFWAPPELLINGGAHAMLALLGVFTGIYVVPLNVFLQSRPPADQKGRVIGAMNLVNWIGIFLASAFYGVMAIVFHWLGLADRMNASGMFATIALVMFVLSIWFRPARFERMTAVPSAA